jgi:hypothetical protein
MSDNPIRITLTDNRIPHLLNAFPQAVDRIVLKTAFEVVKSAVDSMSGDKHGRLYKVKALFASAKGKRGKGLMDLGAKANKDGKVVVGYKTRRASAPGEAPAIDLGNLANGIEAAKTGPGTAQVTVYADYGPALEFGTHNMAARPFMKPAAERSWIGFISALLQIEDMLR